MLFAVSWFTQHAVNLAVYGAFVATAWAMLRESLPLDERSGSR